MRVVQLLRRSDRRRLMSTSLKQLSWERETTMGITLQSKYHCLLCQHIRRQGGQMVGQAADI